MPGIVHYTPPWLSRPSPGFDVFANSHASSDASLAPPATEDIPQHRLRKSIAHRGTEVFVAVGREIRWSDLILLRNEYDSQPRTKSGAAQPQEDEFSHRVLKASVAGPIKQLIISPEGDYIAILTSHTAHIAILPDASHLTSKDPNAIKLKTFQLGPTSHVRENPPIACALWHPLAAGGSALVTITVDAIIRLWELERANRWSFDAPALAIDLRKLANGVSSAEQLTPSKHSSNRGFSPDSFEMEVAAASFGAPETGLNAFWSPATLWIAMTEGDVYALCPLLPSKIYISEPQIDSLAVSQELEQSTDFDSSTSNVLQRELLDRSHWAGEILSQHANGEAQRNGFYKNPSKPGPVPRLQGPVQFTPDDDSIVDITDITALSLSGLNPEVDEVLPDQNLGQSLPPNSVMLCIALDDGTVKVAVSVGGPQARWFRPTKTIPGRLLADQHAPEFVLAESVTIDQSSSESPLMFTRDAESPSAIFVNSMTGVTHLSPQSWASKLVSELDAGVDQGASFRMDVLLEDIRSKVRQIIHFSTAAKKDSKMGISINASIACLDSDVGHFILAVDNDQPYAAQIEVGADDDAEQYPRHDFAEDDEDAEFVNREIRPAYHPPKELWTNPTILDFMKRQPSYSRHSRDKELKMSPHNLNAMMEAHRIISQDTTRLSLVAADMFRRCERLQTELKEQISKARQVADRVESVLDEEGPMEDDQDDQNVVGIREILARRVDAVNEKQEDLLIRHEDLRRKVAQLSRRPLTDKDRVWISEIERVGQLVNSKDDQEEEEATAPANEDARQLENRIKQVQQLFKQIQGEISTVQDAQEPPKELLVDHSVSPEKRKARKAQIDALLERQDALIEATTTRLEQLSRLDQAAA